MKIQIKHYISGSVLFEYDKDSLKLAVEFAVQSKAYLIGADLSGAYLIGADLRGEKLDKQPFMIQGLEWDVMITKQHMRIGCEFHKIEEWWAFDNKQILDMAGKEALVFWKTNKPILKKLWENHCK